MRLAYLFLVLLLIAGCNGSKGSAIHSQRALSTDYALQDSIRRLLAEMVRDNRSAEVSTSWSLWHLSDFLGGRRTIGAVVPFSFATERCIALGRPAYDALASLLLSDNLSSDQALCAFEVLSRVDDPRLPCIASSLSRRDDLHVESQRVVLNKCLYFVPPLSEHLAWRSFCDQLCRDGTRAVRISALDYYIGRQIDAPHHLIPSEIDVVSLAWLNRIYDIDLDDWLQSRAPLAYAFRRRALDQGYDPLFLQSSFRDDAARKAAIASGVFSNKEDESGFSQLMEVLYDKDSLLHPRPGQNWILSLQEYYVRHRDHLIYVPELHRFSISGKESHH